MKVRLIFILLSILFAKQIFAFTCYLTLAKDSCWTNYQVNIIGINPDANKQLVAITVPKGKSWIRQAFTCEPGEKIMFQATYSPIFWQADAGKVYNAQRYLLLPAKIASNTTAWDLPVCFPRDFAEVPFPPDAAGNCQCNFKEIPNIEGSAPAK